MAPETIADIVRTYASSQPGRAALVQDDETVTYAELHERSNRVANGLISEGIGAQDHIGFLDKNCLEFFDLLYGAAKVNAVHAGINWRLTPGEIAAMIADAGSRLLVVGQEFVGALDEMEADLASVEKILVVGGHPRHEAFGAWRDRQDATDPGGRAGPDDTVLLLYSSGTTGAPKGVMIRNGGVFDLMRICSPIWGIGQDSITLVNMPMFHIGGVGWGALAHYNGSTGVVVRENVPDELVTLVERHRITNCFFVPALLQFMCMVPGVETRDFSALEVIVYGAAPITVEVLLKSIDTLRCQFVGVYGLTESSGGVTTLRWEDHDPGGPRAHLLQSAGTAHPNARLKIVDPVSTDEVPTGHVGEIWIQSEQSMKGYWQNPEATAETLLPGGWLRTGDAGLLDADGYLFITDRIKDMIVSGGENIYSAEVENVLMGHPAVADVTVIGVPSDKWGETPLALVVSAEGAEASDRDIIDFCRREMATYKCPTAVEFVDDLPRGATGKVLKNVLRDPYWADRDRKV